MKVFIFFTISLFINLPAYSQATYPIASESDYVIKNFPFESKESLPELNMHYTTFGKPIKDKNGQVMNAVLIMHGTGGNGHQFITSQYAGYLFNPGQILDATKYYIILPDALGHGKSSKPSDGLHMKFPKYTYNDMVNADYRLLTEHLGVNHLRLVMGTSMGGMHTWVWAYTHPDFMDALMPLASLPVEIAGRNRMLRKMAINLIEMDPAWKAGEYTTEPKVGLTGAISSIIYMVSIPLQWQKKAPTRIQADSMLQVLEDHYFDVFDANDMIYQLDASREYNPSPHL
ncbi:MAG: alpha/beta fold hydrolase, partial [Bacteroidota bacterium]